MFSIYIRKYDRYREDNCPRNGSKPNTVRVRHGLSNRQKILKEDNVHKNPAGTWFKLSLIVDMLMSKDTALS